MSRSGLPSAYWPLSGFYFFYFAVLGALLPFWGLYLKRLGFDAGQIGALMAVLAITRIIAPNIWGWLADRTQRRLSVIRFGAAAALLIFVGLISARHFVVVALVMAGYSFFWNAILSQSEVLTLAHLQGKRSFYSRIRLWGSIGFIIAVAGLGAVFDQIDVIYLPYIILAFMILLGLSTLVIRKPPEPTESQERTQGLMTIIKQPSVLAFLVICLLLQVSHGCYYVFSTLYLEDLGYSRTLIGQLWALGVIAEVILFMVMHRLMHRFSIRGIILFSLAVTAGRWLLFAYGADQIGLLLFAQCLHAFSYAAIHAAGIETVHRFFSGGHDGQGQALYSAVSFGAGAAIGAGLSGYLWEASGAVAAFEASSLLALAALVIGFIWFRSPQIQLKPDLAP